MGRPAIYTDAAEALADMQDGASIMLGGFSGGPPVLVKALIERGVRDITLIANGTTYFPDRPPVYPPPDRVKKAIVSFPVSGRGGPAPYQVAYEAGEVELEVVPQGTLAERIRAGGAGIGAFFTPTGAGTLFADGKEVREIDGRQQVLEYGLKADFALIQAWKADTVGNLIYRFTSRNFHAPMATAARVTIVQVDEIVEAGELDPEVIITPGIYVDRIVLAPPEESSNE